MSFLSGILSNITLEEVAAKAPSRAGGVKKQWNPASDVLGIRIWKDGSVFPSQALVEKFDLEYKDAKVTKETKAVEATVLGGELPPAKTIRSYEFPNGTGNGFDVIDTELWGQIKSPQRFLAIAVVPKDQPKVDLFAATRYTDEGKPLSNVLDQGAATFGKEDLLPTLKEVYGIEPNEEGFIDLIVDTSANLKSLVSNGIFLFPKKVTRGKDAGKADYERRENVDIFALVPAQVVKAVEEDEAGVGNEGFAEVEFEEERTKDELS